jgi:hypothetical protein
MALPSSGLIDFSDVRVEMSQSAFTSYAFSGWAAGYNSGCLGAGPNANLAPINLLSSGSLPRYTGSFNSGAPKTMPLSNLSMSAWYGYDHTANISSSITGTLYYHFVDSDVKVSSMIPVDVGTSNATLSLNISGSDSTYAGFACWAIFYGKPWQVDGGSSVILQGCDAVYPSNILLINSGSSYGDVNRTITYNHTYNANSGSYIYYVLYGTDIPQ